MPRMTPGRQRWERINPCLLDKLSDEEGIFPSGSAVMSRKQYAESVRRDLEELLGTRTHLPSWRVSSGVPLNLQHTERGFTDDETLADFPNAAQSVLAYGLPDLRGRIFEESDAEDLARVIEEVIRFFEPRIDPSTLHVERVEIQLRPATEAPFGVLHYRVRGLLWAFPKPEWLDLYTTINVDSGDVSISR